MPFYIRARQLDIPTPTVSSTASDDEDNFVCDPQQIFDDLPQPFRLINKIVDDIVELSWEKICDLELERELEAKRIKPPVYSPSSQLEYSNVSCMSVAESNMIFLGVENSVVAYNEETEEEISKWLSEDQVVIEQISCISLGNAYLLTVIDDMGFARVLMFVSDMFHPIVIFNELTEGTPKSNVTKCELSADGEFCSLALESDKVTWAEVYRLPIENWNREIENARKEFLKKTESASAVPSNAEVTDASEVIQASSSEILFPVIKFSAITPVLKVNQPSGLVGTSARTAQEMLDQIGSDEVIGDGTCHGLTNNYLETRAKLFDALHEEDLKYVKNDTAPPSILPSFHFLSPSCLEPELSLKSELQYPFLGIWWTGNHNFNIYQLMKSGKNVEFKPDSVWPQASNITCTAVSNNTMLLAIGTESGSLTLWDRNLGILRCIVSICANVPITSLFFLNDTHAHANELEAVKLLIGSKNGQIVLFHCSKSKRESLQVVCPAPQTEEKKFALLKMVPKLPEIFCLIDQGGSSEIRNTAHNTTECVLSLPEQYHFEFPYETGCTVDKDGDVLYIRGSELSSSNGNILFLFHLRSFPTLDKYHAVRTEVVESAPPPIKFTDFAQQLLTKRQEAQKGRTDQLASQWHKLNHKLEVVLNLKEAMNVHKKERNYSQSSSASRWSRTTNRIIEHNKDLRS